MRVLKKPALLPVVLLVGVLSCTPRAALTPQAAFHDLKAACLKSDAAMLAKLLSSGSVKKITRMTALFSRMEDRQLEALSKKYGMPAGKLRHLGVADYCALILAEDSGLTGAAAAGKMIGVNRDGNRASVRLANGMDIHFVREGPYWKFDLTAL
jgi:hypothetical protein